MARLYKTCAKTGDILYRGPISNGTKPILDLDNCGNVKLVVRAHREKSNAQRPMFDENMIALSLPRRDQIERLHKQIRREAKRKLKASKAGDLVKAEKHERNIRQALGHLELLQSGLNQR